MRGAVLVFLSVFFLAASGFLFLNYILAQSGGFTQSQPFRCDEFFVYRCGNNACGKDGGAMERGTKWYMCVTIRYPNGKVEKNKIGGPYGPDRIQPYGQVGNYQVCPAAQNDWAPTPPTPECEGQCYPAPTIKPLDQIPAPPYNVPEGGAYKLPINLAWGDLNQTIAPCMVEYYQFEIPGVSPAFSPAPPSSPEPTGPAPPAVPGEEEPTPPPPDGWCSVETLEEYFGANAEKASKVCMKESGGNPKALHPLGPFGGVGLFQISVRDDDPNKDALVKLYLQPEPNIRKAVELSSGGTNWGRWSVSYEYTCYKDTYIGAPGMLGIISGCVPWHQGPYDPKSGKYGVDYGYNCWRCKKP